MKFWQKLSVITIFLFSLAVMAYAAANDSLASDERIHIAAGYLHVVNGDYTKEQIKTVYYACYKSATLKYYGIIVKELPVDPAK